MKNIAITGKHGSLAILGSALALTYLVVTPPAIAGGAGGNSREEQYWKQCYPIDLKSGTASPLPTPFIEYVVPPEDFNGDGWYETVIKVRLNDWTWGHSPAAVRFYVDYTDKPMGMTVNVGDSATNDGFAGDAGTQSNDAEMQIGGVMDISPDEYDDLSVFGHDGLLEARDTQLISRVSNMVSNGEKVALTVSNQRLEYNNPSYPISGDIQSAWLYALKGQPDSEGPVNNDIYAAFNRVIDSNSRWGSGVGKVMVCLLPKFDAMDDHGKDDHSRHGKGK